MIIWVLLFLLILFSGFISASTFNSQLSLWETAVVLVRNHFLNQEISFLSKVIYKIYYLLGNFVIFLDKIPFFPSWLKSNWWTERVVYLFVSLPIIVLITILIVFFKKQKWTKIIALIMFIFWIVPIPKLTKKYFDTLVTKNHWDIKYPWSSDFVWIWHSQENEDIYPYSTFKYQWNQKKISSSAKIYISSLGDYQLIINGQSIYHGPSYAVPPKVYYDTLNITDNIKIGENEIIIISNYSNVKHHRHVTYPSPGLLVGGEIKDGLITRNIADNRLWQVTPEFEWKNGIRISLDSGFSEEFNLATKNQKWEISKKIDNQEYFPQPRTVPLLVEKEESVGQIRSDIFDFGKTVVAYLTASGSLDQECTLAVSWSNELLDNNVKDTSQNDTITFSKGDINWEQFSRRSGRYLKINKTNCKNQLKLGIKTVQMPFIEPNSPSFKQPIDQQIYQLCVNTLKNNIQDHFEDSVVRERAMYIGDAREISRCLMVNNQNNALVKEMIRQFSQSQNEDGSLPAMVPSGNQFIIYDYVFQWIVWLEDYVNKSNDISFAEEMWPTVERIISWSAKNSNPEMFLNNNWWVFIDWTPIDRSQQFTTSLQIWYYRSLISTSSIASKINQPTQEFDQKAKQLSENLVKYAFDSKDSLFVDSFSLEKKSTGKSIITNSLAGLANIFPQTAMEKNAIKKLSSNLYTSDAFSESWVVEWLINNQQTELALKTIRNYWGSMINNGATAVYEYFNPLEYLEPASYSHAWGCGPIYLYKNIFIPIE